MPLSARPLSEWRSGDSHAWTTSARPAGQEPARRRDRLVRGGRPVVGDEHRAVGRNVRLRDDEHRPLGVVQQARRRRAEHRARHRPRARGCRRPPRRRSRSAAAARIGSHGCRSPGATAGSALEARRLREPHALRGGGLRVGNELPLELGQAALDELGRHERTTGAERRHRADRGLVDRQHRRASAGEQRAGGPHGRLRRGGAVERDQQARGHGSSDRAWGATIPADPAGRSATPWRAGAGCA